MPFLFKAEWYSLVCIYHVLFIHSSSEGQLGCSRLLAAGIMLLSCSPGNLWFPARFGFPSWTSLAQVCAHCRVAHPNGIFSGPTPTLMGIFSSLKFFLYLTSRAPCSAGPLITCQLTAISSFWLFRPKACHLWLLSENPTVSTFKLYPERGHSSPVVQTTLPSHLSDCGDVFAGLPSSVLTSFQFVLSSQLEGLLVDRLPFLCSKPLKDSHLNSRS